MPSVTLGWRRLTPVSCEGYKGYGCIKLDYDIPAGVQKLYHPNPGQSHGPARRTAYLPDIQEGRELLSRLQVGEFREQLAFLDPYLASSFLTCNM